MSSVAERERVVEENGSRVAAIARRFRGSGVEQADLTQEGSLALMEALERYEPDRGVPFWPYAAPWVHGAIYRLAHEQRRPLRLPAAARAELNRLRWHEDRIAEEGGRAAFDSVAERAGIPPRRAELLVAADRPARSLEEPIGPEGDGACLGDMVADPVTEDLHDGMLARIGAPDVVALLPVLSDRERDVVCRHFGLFGAEETLAQIGRDMGVTRERARQIEAAAVAKLRRACGGAKDDDLSRPSHGSRGTRARPPRARSRSAGRS